MIQRKVLTLLAGLVGLGTFQPAQAQFYSDFSGYTTTSVYLGLGVSCPTYSCMNVGSGLSGCMPGAAQWGRMGTPSPSGTTLTMVAEHDFQEGIFTNFNFTPGYTYRIHLGIKSYFSSSAVAAPAPIRIYAASNLVQTPDAVYSERSLNCQEPELEEVANSNIAYFYWQDNANQSSYPVVPIPQIDKIDYFSPPALPVTNTVVSDVYVDYTPTVANNQIALHPSDDGANGTTLVLAYVRIDRICDASFTYTIDTRSPHAVTYESHVPNPPNPNWIFGDGTTSTGASVTHLFDEHQMGSYNTCFEVGGAKRGEEGCNNCVSFCIREAAEEGHPPTCADFTYSVYSGTPMVAQFNAINNGSGYLHEWDFGDGTPVVSGASPNHQFPSPGAYNVCHREGNWESMNCERCFEVCFGPEGAFKGIPTAANNNIKPVFEAAIYPNPAIDKAVLAVTVPEDGLLDIHILDIGGRIVKTQTVNVAAGSRKIELQTDGLSSGVYNVALKTGMHHITRKLSIVK